jgi:hypothetical protein
MTMPVSLTAQVTRPIPLDPDSDPRMFRSESVNLTVLPAKMGISPQACCRRLSRS